MPNSKRSRKEKERGNENMAPGKGSIAPGFRKYSGYLRNLPAENAGSSGLSDTKYSRKRMKIDDAPGDETE